ncbi:MAG TPA: Do family serine endopeptidase [Burkholderiales bacterium]|nr:Do family serine endopeptidase [Burkholderiales bacterium]
MRLLLRALPAVALAAASAAFAALPVVVDGQPLPSLAPMLEKVTPAVVNIATLSRSQEANPMMRDPFFRRFFDLPDQPERRERSAGSGVIVDGARGLVITNHHVIRDAQEIVVVLKDRRVYKAQLVGSDSGTDIALLRIQAENLTAIRIGDSDAVNVGDFVVAIGNPFGIGQTVTSGIVSALGRSGIGAEGYEEFIQTDASINPGNSGGALVNLRGELIGINTAILGPTGGNVGIGFAVPTNMARAVIDQIQRFGEVRRGRLGVETEDLTPDTAKQLGVSVTEGAVVLRVEKGSAAEKAGLRPKDVVIAVNERPIRASGELRNRVGLTPVGEEVDMTVLRDGKQIRVRARVGELYRSTSVVGEGVPQLAGLKVADIQSGMPMYGQVEGVFVVGVERESAAFKNGLHAGDVIFGVGRTRVRSVKQFNEALRTAEQPLRLALVRGDYRIQLVIR